MLLKKAVLIIHGFAGGTYDEEYLANYLELKGFDVYTFTLPGHDRMLFNKITKEDWIESARIHLEMLINNKYKQIYVIGHSMGGVCPFCLKEKVKIYLDNSLKKYEYVYPAGGSSNSAVKLTIKELESIINNPVWIDVVKYEEEN